ncbi:response regulator, partial [Vibrio parahaemolyticus V-223/04]
SKWNNIKSSVLPAVFTLPSS